MEYKNLIVDLLWRFKFIKAVCETPVVGSFSAELETIINVVRSVSSRLGDYYTFSGEIESTHSNLENIQKNFYAIVAIIKKTSSQNLAHNILTIRNLCVRNIEDLSTYITKLQ